MPIEFRCPGCERLLKTSDDKAGASAKCPQCGFDVLVPAAIATPNAASDELTREMPPPMSVDTDRRDAICPMCGAKNEEQAPRCLACGEQLWTVQWDGHGPRDARRFRDVWNEAWAKWTANIGMSAAAAAIAGGMFFAAYLAFILLMMVVFGFAAAAPGGGDAVAIGMVTMVVVGYLSMFAIYACALAGLSNFALRLSRNREAELSAMFPSASKCLSSLFSTLLIVLALLLAMAPGIALYVAGLQLSGDDDLIGVVLVIVGYGAMFVGWGLGWTFFWPVHYVITDELPVQGSKFVQGVRIALANLKLSFLLALTNTGLMFAGYTTCYVGLLFAAPLSFVLCAVAYNRCARMAFGDRRSDVGDQNSITDASALSQQTDLRPPTSD